MTSATGVKGTCGGRHNRMFSGEGIIFEYGKNKYNKIYSQQLSE
jgi:hypothetical protein